MAADKNERKLAAQVRERFDVPVPTWRKNPKGKVCDYVRVYSKAEKAEMKALEDWICADKEYRDLFDVYFGYVDILRARGFVSGKDYVIRFLPAKWHEEVLRNFAESQIRYIYHDMCCDPGTILGKGSADGYWIYLDRRYLDIPNMTVGDAIINLDEVWAVVDGTLREWLDKGLERESHLKQYHSIKCDRCGERILDYKRHSCRFDVFENLLHCEKCVAECTHWKNIDKGVKHGKAR